MNPILILAESADRVADVERAWNDFDAAVCHPLRGRNFRFRTGKPIKPLAWARPLDGSIGEDGHITLSSRLLDTKTPEQQQLTILHETIHLGLFLGEHREHWQRYRSFVQANKLPRPANISDEDLSFRDRKLEVADLLWGRCDEVYAELYLQTHFPEWARDRTAYLLEMALSTPVPASTDDELYRYDLLYLAAKLDLCGVLSKSPPLEWAKRAEDVDSKLASVTNTVMSTARTKLRELTLATPPDSIEPALNELYIEVVNTARRDVAVTNSGTSEPANLDNNR